MAGPFDLMKGTSKVLVQNLFALHFNGEAGTFIDNSGLEGGVPAPGSVISTVNAAYLISIFDQVREEFAGTPLEGMAADAISAQAGFLLNNLQDSDGGYFNAFDLDSGADNSAKLIASQAAAVKGLYAAYEATGDTDYLEAGDAAYNYLLSNFYIPAAQAFRTEEGNGIATYTPENFAIAAGALRAAALTGGFTEAAAIYTRSFKSTANAMQLSEGEATGEAGSDSDIDGIPFIPEQSENLPPVFATEGELNLALAANLAGDVNLDADVNIFDVLVMVELILNPATPPTDDQLAFGDLIEDGVINIFDVVAVINLILNEPAARTSDGTAIVAISDNSITISGENIAGIEFHTAGGARLSIQDIPEGWQIYIDNGILVGFSAQEVLDGNIRIDYAGELEVGMLLLSNGQGGSIDYGGDIIPSGYALRPAFPNPFNPSTTLQFELPTDSAISLQIYDISGRLVEELVNDVYSAGVHSVTWDAGSMATGIYLVRLDSENFHQMQKIMLIK